MDQKKSKEKSTLAGAPEPKPRHGGKDEILHRDFGVFGKIQKVDLSLQEDDLEYLLYAQTVSQK